MQINPKLPFLSEQSAGDFDRAVPNPEVGAEGESLQFCSDSRGDESSGSSGSGGSDERGEKCKVNFSRFVKRNFWNCDI